LYAETATESNGTHKPPILKNPCIIAVILPSDRGQGYTNVKTTSIYAKVVDEKKEKAAHAIKLNIKK
jgi:hypothetical protein